MYRRRSNSGGTLLKLIVVGLIVGVVYYVVNQRQPETAAVPTMQPVVPPTQAAPTLSPTATAPARLTEATLFIPTAGVYSPVIESYLQPTGDWDIGHLGNNVGHLQ